MGEKTWQGFDLRAPRSGLLGRSNTTVEDRILARRKVYETRFALPQSGFSLSASVIPGGGGPSSGGLFKLNSTIGQPLAGTTQTGGQFSLTAGFGAVVQGATSTPTPTPTPSPTPTPTPCQPILTVNDNGDSNDASVGDGFCATASGVCTLRAAIQEANARPACGAIDINFSVTGSITLGTALPNVNHSININGPGTNQLTVQRSTAGGTPNFRIFTINSGVSSVISGVTIINGRADSGGGGIANDGTLNLLNVMVNANQTTDALPGDVGSPGGGIYNNGQLRITNSAVSGNMTGKGSNGLPGGRGGGIYNLFPNTVTVVNSTVSGNSTGDGGNGASGGEGGGIFSQGLLEIANSAISNNHTGGGGLGGGIYSSNLLTLTNSTISGNQTGNGNGNGGGILSSGTATVTNSTVANNSTGSSGNGGGICNPGGTTNIRNTIVANNVIGAGGTGADISGFVNSQDYNLIGNTSGAIFTGTTAHNIANTNANLGPLANNGGPTLTHALLLGSPAINAGDNCVVNNSCSPALASALTTDQRGTGFSRLVNTAVDIGAFEVQASPPPPTVQFSSSTYTVNEGSPRVDITLTRSGDTTSSASVSFATNDGAGLTNCNVFNGIASPRCDYENTIGTATWAAGDATSKSFSIAIVDDSYAEGTETFTIGLNSPSGASMGTQSTATVTITDNEVTNGPNPIDNTNFFVRQQYIDFLGREPDPPGFAGWTSTINNCATGDTSCDRIHVSQLFFQSEEFQTRGYFVYRFYPVAFGRKPDYGEFVPDLARVSGFLDANQLEAAKVAFIADFMARTAFVNTYNALTNQQYVDALLNTAGVTLSSRQSLIDGLNNSTLTRAVVLRQIVESAEVATKYNHQAYAVMEYFGYLRRQPDAFYLDWIIVLDQSNDPRGMVTGFVNSLEYRNRFGP